MSVYNLVYFFKRWPNYLTLWPVAPVLRSFVQYLIAFCSRLKAASDDMFGRFVGLTVPDKWVKFRDRRLNRSREIRPKSVESGIIDGFFAITYDQK